MPKTTLPATCLALTILLAGALAPLAAADPGDPLWKCDQDPVTMTIGAINQLLANIGDVVTYATQKALAELAPIAGKVKCTVMENLGVCSDETIPGYNAPLTPTSTGSAHPHRDVCWQYYIYPNTCGWKPLYRLAGNPTATPCDNPGTPLVAMSPCPPGEKVERRYDHAYNTEVTSCTGLTSPYFYYDLW